MTDAAVAGGFGLAGWESALLAVCCAAGLFAVLLAHELGHLLGGRLVGFRAFLLIIGPFRMERGALGWVWHRNTSLSLAGGMAGSAPADAVNLRTRSGVMVAGGPVASVILGVLGLLGWWFTDPSNLGPNTPLARVIASFVLLTVGGTSLGIALVTLVPACTSGFYTDGARLLMLLHGGPVAERDAAIQAVVGASLAGVRPRDWSPALLERARSLVDGSMQEVVAWQLTQTQCADVGATGEALEWLERVLSAVDRLPPVLHTGVRLDAARQLAMAGEVERARALLMQSRGAAIGGPYLRPLAVAALAVADGAHDRAALALDEARPLLATALDRGGAAWLMECVRELEAARTTP